MRRSRIVRMIAVVLTLLASLGSLGSASAASRIKVWINFISDGNGQCGGYGEQWASANKWTPNIIFDTDNRAGGCWLQFAVEDPDDVLEGLQLSYTWIQHPGSDWQQCTNASIPPSNTPHTIPIGPTKQYSDLIRVDTDERAGWCDLTFNVSGLDDIGLEVKFEGDSGQCHQPPNPPPDPPLPPNLTAQEGKPVTLEIDTDNDSGGCTFALKLVRLL